MGLPRECLLLLLVPLQRRSKYIVVIYLATVTNLANHSLLGMNSDEAQRMFLFIALRDMISAAKRLALVGPNASVRLQTLLQSNLEHHLIMYRDREETLSHVTFPLADILQSCQGSLQRKLFLS